MEKVPNNSNDPLKSSSLVNTENNESFIFLDARGKRWPRLKRLMFIAGGLVFVGMILFVQTLLVPSQLTLPPAVEQLKSRLKILQSKKNQLKTKTTKPLWLDFAKRKINNKTALRSGEAQKNITPLLKKSQAPNPAFVKEIRLGFYETGDPESFDSLKTNADKLTHLCPDWLTVEDGLGKLNVTKEQNVLDLVKDQEIILLPLLRNQDDRDIWLPEAVEGLINGPAARQDQFITSLKDALKGMDAGGVIIDWQQIDPSYRNPMTAFLEKIATALHDDSMELWLCVPAGMELDILDLDMLAQHVDRFVAMIHDENGETDPPGPIASPEYFNGWLTALVDSYGKPSQWIIALGSYGYDWTEGEKKAEAISFEGVMNRASRSSIVSCDVSPPSYNPHFNYEDDAAVHTVWFLDAITFLNQLITGRQHEVGGIAISRLGTEDPDIWDVLEFDTTKPLDQEDLAKLETIKPGDTVTQIGKGNLVTIADERSDGTRRITLEKKEKKGKKEKPKPFATEIYNKFPSYLTVVHQSRGPNDAVSLTFDDGPDPTWTPLILDILKAKGVHATFFMIGANMEKYPDIVKRIVAEGHMIGVHTYSHPNIALVSEERAHLEFNATQRLTEAITDHSTILFRPPYNADINPREAGELVPIQLAQKMGYITITEDIDPEDWQEPGVNTIIERIKNARIQGGSIVLLHDAGGDRSQTIEALPSIIDYLRKRGDTLLSLPEMLGIPPEQLMPVVPVHQQPVIRMISESGFKIIHEMARFFWAFMIVATSLIILKTFVVSWLAVRSRNTDESALPQQSPDEPWTPVSILVAAYNEEKVIQETLRAVLKTTYPGQIEIMVVDDGSKDATAEIVAEMMQSDGRIRLIRQVNLGKAMALRNGLEAVSHEIVISLDADTQFTPGTIGELVRPFADPLVGAVSGRARVGNPQTLFARFQSLEYTCGFNLDRRAYHRLNCITVVPGAVGAFRLSAIKEAGGISTDTLAEDTDLTLSLHKCGYTICYTSRAVAWTEAPETIKAFAKQRFRWAFGTLQCLWKHRELLFNSKHKALGWFSLPSAWFFNIILVALGSVIDGILLFSLVVRPANAILYFYFFIFLFADLLLAVVACYIEKEPLNQVWLVFPMRFIYRPVLSFVVAKAIIKASKGVLVGWGKLDRTASVVYKA